MTIIKNAGKGTIGRVSMLALAIAAWAPAAQAQDAEPAAEEAGLGEIIVTAQRRAENVQDVPLAVSVSTAADLERLQVTNIQSLQYSSPSLVVAGSDPSRLRFGIRGISDGSRNAGFENRIGVYVDGVWVGRSAAANQSVLDLASIEVLRGPQGTLFGKNTVAGAINITSVRPDEGYSGYVEGELGNYDRRQLRGAVNLGFSDTAALRVSGSYLRRDGFTQNISNNLSYDNRDDYNLRAQFQLEAGDTTFYITADTAKIKSRALAGGERVPDPLAPLPRQIAHDDLQQFEIAYDGISGEIEHAFGNGGTLTSITAFRGSRLDGSADEDFSPASIAATDISFEDSSHFSQELRYASPTDGDFDYLIGLFFLDQTVEGIGQAFAFARAINPAAPAIFVTARHESTVKTKNYAAFLHANYRPAERLEITLGARVTVDDKSIDYRITDQSGLFTNGTLRDDRKRTDFSPTVSINYQATDDVMTYARYSRGFKSGGWNADFVRSIADIEFDDESVDSFELGLKSTLFDKRLRLNIAAYLSKHADYQVFSFVQLSNGGTALNVSNAGELTSKGIEIEAEAAPTDWLTLFANYGYNDASFDSFANGGGPGVDFDGNRAADAPKHNLNLGVATDFDLGFAQLVLQGDYNYRSSFFSNPDNLAVNLNGSLEQVNLRAGLDFGNVSVFGWMRNAFDVTETIFNSRSFLGLPRAVYNDPQTYGLTLKVSFGQ
jgi:iron complex outermembrane receptor protein